MDIIRDKEILNFRESSREKNAIFTGQYPHIVEDKIYYQIHDPLEIGCAVFENGTYRKLKNDEIDNFHNSLAVHNFRVFVDTNTEISPDERYKAIGGYHVGRKSITKSEFDYRQNMDSEIYGHLKGCEVSRNSKIKSFPDPVWPEEIKLLFHDDYNHPKHANGLYLFKSADGINWELYNDKPIFSCFTPLEEYEYTLSFDLMPSILYDFNINEYIIYLRSNIKLGCRHVFYSKSKDLINWDKPKLINVNNFNFNFNSQFESLDNFYHLDVNFYNDKYLGFIPYFKNNINPSNKDKREYYDQKTLIMVSDDGVNWDISDEIFHSDSGKHMRQNHLVSFREEDDVLALYVHEGYHTYDNKLVRYFVNKRDFLL